MENIDPDDLLKKYSKGACTPEEEALVECFYLEDDGASTDGNLKKGGMGRRWYLRLGAMISLITIFCAIFFVLRYFHSKHLAEGSGIHPGFNQAILVLADGRKIDLTNAKTGLVAEENGIELIKAADGQLVYKVKKHIIGNQYHTVRTPRGGQYQVVLPDGTRVWLNAESSITYETNLKGRGPERRVKMSGEAYFDVTRDPDRPFIVSTSRQELRVLGTHFNVMAYEDDLSTKTTVLEGSVSILSRTGKGAIYSGPSGEEEKLVVNSNQQSTVFSTERVSVHAVDAEQIVAWKDGSFMFRYESLESIMLRIARWYDVEVFYENTQVKEQLFGGAVSRFEKISEVLGFLELTGDVHFKINGRKIIVR